MGPLSGLKIVEFAGIGAGPFCAMLLSELGANVVRIDRPTPARLGVAIENRYDLVLRGRRSVAIDLKIPGGLSAALRLTSQADALIESFRPGVMERIGLGPDVCVNANPRLVYARLTGWGQNGPYAQMAGHDINYIALTGALLATGNEGVPPTPPLNLLGDFAGGALYCAIGILSAMLSAQRAGSGQVIDAAMTDGVSALMTMIIGFRAGGAWSDRRADNVVDGGAPYYRTYETADARYISIGAIEEKFYELLLAKLGLGDVAHMRPQSDKRLWEKQRATFAAVFKSKTRAEWCAELEGTDVCFAPVLTMDEAPHHPHLKARGTYVTLDGVTQPAPQPRFGRTAPSILCPPAPAGTHTNEVLREWGWSDSQLQRDLASGAVVQT